MTKLCILLCLSLAPMCALAAFEECEMTATNRPVLPPEGINSYIAYNYSVSGGQCSDTTVACNATIIPDYKLRGRTWFIDDMKRFDGFGYGQQQIQVYNIQCPRGSLLHLYMQGLQTEGDGTNCDVEDFISVSGPDFETEVFCGNFSQIPSDSSLQNGGLGRIITNGSAQVEFCSNSNDMRGNGFVLRATCLDPREWSLPGCTDFAFTLEWDRPFIDESIDGNFIKPARVPRPHKRSAEKRGNKDEMTIKRIKALMKRARSKRFARFSSVDLGPFDNVTYSNRMVVIEFDNGTVRTFNDIGWFVAHNPLIGTRVFDVESPFMFQGPGKISFYGKNAWIEFSIPDLNNFFLPSPGIQQRVNQIYDYIYDCYVRPYPVILDDITGMSKVFPLPGDDSPFLNPNIRESFTSGWVMEDIQNGNCRRVVRTEIAPAKKSFIDEGILSFCRFFSQSCDLSLRTACREALLADSGAINFFG